MIQPHMALHSTKFEVMECATEEEYLRENFENIEDEMRMERIRQAAARHNWAHFNDIFYKNFMDKRIRLDANDKEDWQNAIQFLRKNLPCDDGRETATQLRYLAEHIGCEFEAQPGVFKLKGSQISLEVVSSGSAIASTSVSSFGGQMKDSPTLTLLMGNQRWGTILSSLTAMRGLLPLGMTSREEKDYYLRSLEILERDLLDTGSSSLPIVQRINQGLLGLCQPRTDVSPFTIHLVADPKAFFDPKSPNLFSVNEEALMEGALVPCARLCISSSNIPNLFPDRSFLDSQGNWVSSNTGRSLLAAFCLRFARPIIFCASALKKLSELCTGELKSEGGLNIYRYLMDVNDCERNELFVKLPSCVVQRFTLDDYMLSSVDDGIVEEICFAHPRDAIAIVSIVRCQLAHNFLFESLVRAHYPTACMAGAVSVRLSVSSLHNYELIFEINGKLYVASVQVLSPIMKVSVETIGGVVIEDCSHRATSVLSKTWSLALMLRSILRRSVLGTVRSSGQSQVLKNEFAIEKNDIKLSH